MIVVCTGIYTMIGGMTAVIYTEVLQTVVLVFGAFVLMVILFLFFFLSEINFNLLNEGYNLK